MSYTTFSSILPKSTQVVPSAIQGQMKEGQVVHGTIKKIFPDQTAEVQIGNQKVIAKLETPLKAGDAHFFQVTKPSPDVQFKVVTGPLKEGNSIAGQAGQLIQAMNLPKTPEMQAVVQYFIKEQLPVSKDLLLQAEQLVKQLPSNVTMKQALDAIQTITELKLPLTQQNFDTVISGKSTNGLQSLIQDFKHALQLDASIPFSVKNNILQSLQKLAEPFGEPVAGVLLGKQVEMLQNAQASNAVKIPLLQGLKEAGILQPNASLQNVTPVSTGQSIPSSAGDLLTQLTQAPAGEKGVLLEQLKNWVSTQSLLTMGQKEQILSLLKEIGQPIQLSNVHKSLVGAFAVQSQQAIFREDANGLTAKEHLVTLLGKGANSETVSQTLQQVMSVSKDSLPTTFTASLKQSEEAVLKQLDGKAFEHAMKEVLKSLGFSYEAKLSGNNEEVRQIATQLKPQIVDLLQNQLISTPLKDQSELLLNRMNGLQILSNENGPQHQLLMQVPLEFLGKKMDATLEWKGRMKEDGKIDSDFARIMFYLQLETLKETVVDMQVQNRVVSIYLYNQDTNLQLVANTFKETLKDGLSTVGYKLSGVFAKTFEEQKLSSQLRSKSPSIESQGVDIRI